MTPVQADLSAVLIVVIAVLALAAIAVVVGQEVRVEAYHRRAAAHRKPPARPQRVPLRTMLPAPRPRLAIEAPAHHVTGERPPLHTTRPRWPMPEPVLPAMVTLSYTTVTPDGMAVYDIPGPVHEAAPWPAAVKRPSGPVAPLVDDSTDQWTRTFDAICPAGRQ